LKQEAAENQKNKKGDIKLKKYIRLMVASAFVFNIAFGTTNVVLADKPNDNGTANGQSTVEESTTTNFVHLHIEGDTKYIETVELKFKNGTPIKLVKKGGLYSYEDSKQFVYDEIEDIKINGKSVEFVKGTEGGGTLNIWITYTAPTETIPDDETPGGSMDPGTGTGTGTTDPGTGTGTTDPGTDNNGGTNNDGTDNNGGTNNDGTNNDGTGTGTGTTEPGTGATDPGTGTTDPGTGTTDPGTGTTDPGTGTTDPGTNNGGANNDGATNNGGSNNDGTGTTDPGNGTTGDDNGGNGGDETVIIIEEDPAPTGSANIPTGGSNNGTGTEQHYAAAGNNDSGTNKQVIVIEDEETPLGSLPQTGGIPFEDLIFLGTGLSALGFVIRKKR
jgi:LPXTG-motif cell wall-anchored protein